MRILGIIPSRYASNRLPAKPLCDIGGKTIIQRVYEQAKRAKALTEVVIATDHKKIYDHVRSLGAKSYMTSPRHASGTDRCCEALKMTKERFDYVINIQGDEPFIAPGQIDLLASILDGKVAIGTLVKKIEHYTEIDSVNVVKVVLNKQDEAIYFSRAPIPHMINIPKEQWIDRFKYTKHLGLYAYRSDVLTHIAKLPPSPLEKAESLEQLRWLENGYTINVVKTSHGSVEIDTPSDLAHARTFYEEKKG